MLREPHLQRWLMRRNWNGVDSNGNRTAPCRVRGQHEKVSCAALRFTMEKWIAANGCDEVPLVEALPDLADDGMTVKCKTWANGTNRTEVLLIEIEIEGGVHTWPGVEPPGAAAFLGKSTRDISANDLMWDFFQKHRRQSAETAPLSWESAKKTGAEGARFAF